MVFPLEDFLLPTMKETLSLYPLEVCIGENAMVSIPVGTGLPSLNGSFFSSDLCQVCFNFINFSLFGAVVVNHGRLSVWISGVVLDGWGLTIRIFVVD